MSNVIHTQSKKKQKKTNNTIRIMEIKYWVQFLKLIVTCYIAVCLVSQDKVTPMLYQQTKHISSLKNVVKIIVKCIKLCSI